MTSQTLAVLKSYFNTGDMPTELQFHGMLESFPPVAFNFLVAAYNAPQRVKDWADYVCDGVNDETEIQAAIDALPAEGGQINFSGGTFTVDQAGVYTGDGRVDPYSVLISTQGPVTLAGVPGATKISFRAGAAVSTLFMVFIRGLPAARRTSPTIVTGIEFLGNNLVAECLDSKFSESITVDHCRFSGGGLDNIASLHLSWNGGRSIITNNYFSGERQLCLENNNYIVANNIFNGAGNPGKRLVWLAPDYDLTWFAGQQYTIYSSVVMGNTFIGGEKQLIMSATRSCAVIGNTFSFQDSGNAAALYMVAAPVEVYAPGFDVNGNTVIGNTFTDIYYAIKLGGYTMGYGSVGCVKNIIAENTIIKGELNDTLWYGIIETGGTCDYNQIKDNHLDACGVTAIAKVGANTVVSGNVGYKTEAQGAASTADGGTIAHGCAATPTVATVSGSVAGEIVTVTAISSTTITVAIKKNDGSAGTTQTVYWRAEV